MTEQDRVNHQKSSSEAYETVGVDHLLIFCVKKILDNNEECTLERLVYECFTIFPKKFGLSRYPHWPDSTRVYRSWRRCRIDNGWLKGSPAEGFRLTSKGEESALTMANKLNSPISSRKPSRVTSKTRGKEEAIIRYLQKSAAFRRWSLEPASFIISGPELRSLLNATLETPHEVLHANMEYYQENARILNNAEMLAFLDACRDQHKDLLLGR